MDIRLSAGKYSTEEQLNPQQILIDWSKAMNELHYNYTELSSYIGDVAAGEKQDGAARQFIGQCPVDQLTSLVARMQNQLEQLIADMSRPDEQQLSLQKRYRQMVSHTLILDQLNQQAQLSFHWLSVSAC